MEIGALMFSMEFHGKCPNPPCKYFPWKSIEKCPWNSMEIDVLILHGIPWRIFHGIPWRFFTRVIIIFAITLPRVYSIIVLNISLIIYLLSYRDPMIPNVNLVHFTDRRELFTNRIPLSSVRTVLTDRKTVNTHSCHENNPSPTNEMRFTERKTLFTDSIPLLSIRSIRTDRQTVYDHSCHENILSPAT